MNDWFAKQQESFEGELRFEEPLSRHTYYQIGGPARVLAIPKSLSDLKILARGVQETQTPYFFLGRGSNLLVSDSGFPGLVIKTGRMNLEIQESGERLRTGSGVAISNLLRKAGEKGWGGFEFLTGVPGSVGGAVWMNAGTHLGESKDLLEKVEVFDLEANGGQTESFEGDQLKYTYRKNHFLTSSQLVWAAEWRIRKEDPAEVAPRIREMLERRKKTQPIDHPSCGSVFKNPKGLSEVNLHAWQVIEKLGLRGHQIGGARFSEKHCNFIVNDGNAKAQDVKALIDLAKTRAKTEMGLVLEEEVRCIGFEK